MTVFQWMTIPLLSLAAIYDIVRLAAGAGRRRFRLMRIVTWTTATVLILFPHSTSHVADLLGIGQGKDLLFYSFILVSVAVAFGFYAKCQALERQITEMVRNDAIRHAEAPQPGRQSVASEV